VHARAEKSRRSPTNFSRQGDDVIGPGTK